MEKYVTVRKKGVYGKELIYPVCELSKKFAGLTGKKTISPFEIGIIKSLGYEVRLQPQSL